MLDDRDPIYHQRTLPRRRLFYVDSFSLKLPMPTPRLYIASPDCNRHLAASKMDCDTSRQHRPRDENINRQDEVYVRSLCLKMSKTKARVPIDIYIERERDTAYLWLEKQLYWRLPAKLLRTIAYTANSSPRRFMYACVYVHSEPPFKT